jgi:hypothetical protein
MGFARREFDDDAIKWNRIQAQLESAEDHDPDEPLLVDGLNTTEKETSDDEEDEAPARRSSARRAPPRPTRAARTAPRAPLRPLPQIASPEVAEARLPKIKAAAERMKRMKKVAINPEKKYRRGQVLFDPGVQKFGSVVYTGPGYVRLEMRDGSQATQGKPPLEDRKNFVLANFERMDNKTMADILDISVHTMRRLCHEYGLKRYGKKQTESRRKTA